MLKQIATSRISWIIRDLFSEYGIIILFCIISFFLGFFSFQTSARDSLVHFDIHPVAFDIPVKPLMLPESDVTLIVKKTAPLNKNYTFWKTILAKVTAYTPDFRSCGRFADGRTSIGHNAWNMDGVAADPRAVPYGTLVFIPGIGYKEVDDTGTAMRKSWARGVYHFDLRMAYNWNARQWGVKWMRVKLFRRKY